jgi:ABC-type branched-subunit amino acid transport system substrate-binding protein
MFNLVDTAQKCLIRYARLFPVFQVEDTNVKTQIEQALKNADNGEPFTFTSKSLSKLGIDSRPGVDVINLGDISAVDKIQYLSTYHNDLLRRFYSMYGMSYAQSMKQAQQSIEEIHSDAKVSWIIPNDRLNERKKFIEKYNKVFGHNATVDFSQAWKDGYNEFLQSSQITGGDQNEEME